MKPAPFDYIAPTSFDETLSILQQHGDDAKLLAGGQSLIPVMNFRLAQPTMIVDLNRLTSLSDMTITDSGELVIGTMVRQRQLERSPLIAQHAPLIHEAMPYIAHPQIRNRGTLGGSLAHADPAGELPTLAVVLEAKLKLQRKGQSRWVNAEEFYIELFTTTIEPEEVLTDVVFPAMPAHTGVAFHELARRHGDYAQAGVAVCITLTEQGVCQQARLGYLNVGDVPMMAHKAADMLVGETISETLIDEAAQVAAQHEIEPVDDVHATAAYKRHLAYVLGKRALQEATGKIGIQYVNGE
ncbi:MAG: xanthine dehydrogenase family protein subunit M [Chloroflexota bacterium]